MEQVVAGADDAREAGLVQPHFLEEDEPLVHVHRHQVGLDRGRDDDRIGALGLGLFEHPRRQVIAVGGIVLVDVAHVEHGLGGDQLRLREVARFFLVLGHGEPRGLALAQQFERLAEHARGDLRFLVALRALLEQGGDALLEAFEVGQQQFGLDHFGVGDRIDRVGDMLDVVILETAQDVDDRVDLADVAEELVAEPFALATRLSPARRCRRSPIGSG